jgi:5-formyltetrahydrofolate cyclo-ligase
VGSGTPGTAPPDALGDSKRELRRRVLAQRDALPLEARTAGSAAATRRVLALPAFEAATAVLSYASFGSEFDTATLNVAVLAAGKDLLLPRIDRGKRALRLYRVRDLDADLLPGLWGIREPDPSRCAEAPASAAGLILVPGVAFDATGGRLGYGGGFYDRLLPGAALTAALVAAAFELQVVESVPMGPLDRRVELLVTEARTLSTRSG